MTKDGEIFSAGRKVETAATENVAVGGLQKVTISGDFDDGTTQFLWEGMLNLVDGGEVVWMKFYGATGGKTAYNNYGGLYWRVYPVQSDGNKISTQPTPLKIAFTLKGDNLKMEFTPCPGFVIDKPDYREVTVNPLEFNEYTQADALFVKFYPL